MRQKQNKKQVQKQSQKQVQKQMTQITERKKDNSTKYLCLFIVVIAFTLAFTLLINKEKNSSYMNDINENNLGVTPQVGKVIVARDMGAIYPKYYVVYINDDEYSLYVYNYYDTTSQYNLEYNRLINKIVDYNAKEKMIRYLHSKGYGTYVDVLDSLSTLVESDNLLIY